MNATAPLDKSEPPVRHARIALRIARTFLLLSFLTLLAAWCAELRGGAVFGLNPQHWFSDATVFALLGIGGMIDAWFHAQWPGTF